MAARGAAATKDVGKVAVDIDADKTVATREVVQGLSVKARQDAIGNATALSELRQILGVKERDWQEIEPSFDVVDKATFEGIAFVIGGFRFNSSEKYMKKNEAGYLEPSEFVSVLAAAYDPESEEFTTPWLIFNDGSTGIQAQLKRYADNYGGDERLAPPITVSKGLRRSDYTYQDEATGDVSEATTWYLG